MFFHDEVEPIHQCIVYAFMHAETRNVDSIMGEGPLFVGGQVQRRGEDAGFMSSR